MRDKWQLKLGVGLVTLGLAAMQLFAFLYAKRYPLELWQICIMAAVFALGFIFGMAAISTWLERRRHQRG